MDPFYINLGIYLFMLLFVFQAALHLAAFCTWFERKGSALIQDRIGANRAGRYFETGLPRWADLLLAPLLLPIRFFGRVGVINTLVCDAVKAIFKEDFVPEGQSKFFHALGPFFAVMPVFVAFAVMPMAPDFELLGVHVRPQLAHLDAGILFFLAMGSVAVYGVIIAGWSGNNKFSLLGGLRAAAQMISYELAMGIAFVTVIVVYGTLNITEMVEWQRNFFHWGVFVQPITFITLFIVGFAETKRGPFDLPESESELVAGYFTEYSGMKFLLFWLGEFCEIALFSFLIVLLFFGGWHVPYFNLSNNTWWGALLGHLVLVGKVVFFCMLQVVIRWTLPRFRYDQLMRLGWKYLLPLSLVNLMVYAGLKVAGVF